MNGVECSCIGESGPARQPMFLRIPRVLCVTRGSIGGWLAPFELLHLIQRN